MLKLIPASNRENERWVDGVCLLDNAGLVGRLEAKAGLFDGDRHGDERARTTWSQGRDIAFRN
eukprot:scaffold326_cov334-Pinguiococcus_pyrenoidosus.AAC.2